jgi:hypothetical protein
MTRRETRKTRSDRRARIETESLESRSLLSGATIGRPTCAVDVADIKQAPQIVIVLINPQPLPPGRSPMLAEPGQSPSSGVVALDLNPQPLPPGCI